MRVGIFIEYLDDSSYDLAVGWRFQGHFFFEELTWCSMGIQYYITHPYHQPRDTTLSFIKQQRKEEEEYRPSPT